MTDLLRLDERVPDTGFSSPDDALEAFLAWASDRGLKLYPHQESAILELFAGNHVVLDTPTGSGKSMVAVAMLFKAFTELGRAWYTAPIKALVSEKFFELCRYFGPEHVGLMTGDGAINRDAPILCCTAEILANAALRQGPDVRVTHVVMDEFHYYGDKDRGISWQIPLLTLPDTTFLLMSGTLGDTTAIRADLAERTGRPVAEVKGVVRPVPLNFSYSMVPIQECISKLVSQGQAPVYVVHFTQNAATEQAQALTSVDFCSKEEKKAIADAVRGFSFHSPFGQTMRRYVLHGIGLHHAGLLPRYRLLVERLAQQGLLKIICGTDTLGVGINVPIRTVLFTQLCKFDGDKVTILPVRDFKQIAGRAGRAGYDVEGYVVVQAPGWMIENARAKTGDPKKDKKRVKAQPPTKGYKHWDETTFQQLIERPPEALEGRFEVDHGRLLSVMQHAQDTDGDAMAGVDAMKALIDGAHVPAKRKDELKKKTDELVEQLKGVGVLLIDDGRWSLDPTLQQDFSLYHTLSLFLIDAIASVDPRSPTHALDVVSWVEAVMEHPRAILGQQVSRAREAKLLELKAAGIPFEERQEILEEVTWPKPNGEHIYAFFNAYAEKHPWLEREAIRPKSIAREMIEVSAAFHEYVRDLGLQRSEGVLLRYLTEVYKALVQNVPKEDQSDTILDHIAYLRAMLGQVDASLLTEWEQLMRGADAPTADTSKADISADKRAFTARIRAELHAIVRALSKGEWEEAAAVLCPDDEHDWDADAISQTVAPFVLEHGSIAFDPRARQAWATVITPLGAHQWEVRQTLYPPAAVAVERYDVEGHEDEDEEETWTLVGRVDLRADTNPDGPIVRLVSIGA